MADAYQEQGLLTTLTGLQVFHQPGKPPGTGIYIASGQHLLDLLARLDDVSSLVLHHQLVMCRRLDGRPTLTLSCLAMSITSNFS